jgi:hypothetical protein
LRYCPGIYLDWASDEWKSEVLLLEPTCSVLFVSQVCIQAMGHTECINPLKQAMQARKDMIGVVCEALNRLFSTNHDQLISQVGHTTFAVCFSPIYSEIFPSFETLAKSSSIWSYSLVFF